MKVHETMTCQQAEDWLVDRARGFDDQAPGPAARHVALCARCAAALDEQRGVSESLALLTRGTSGLTAPAEMEGRLLQAFVSERRSAPRSAPGARTWWLATAAALAAAVVIVLRSQSLAVQQQQQPQAQAPVAAVRPSAVPAEPVSVPAVSAGVAERRTTTVAAAARPMARPAANRRRVRPASPVRAARAEPEAPEITTPFVRLPYAEALPESDSLQVVRVALPRSALVAYGWPAADVGARSVPADLLVGDDGMARAIRFVSQ